MAVLKNSLDLNDLINTAVFQVTDAAGFLWHQMDDASIIYDSRSGHSQAMNDFAREIFDIIADQPCRLSDILSELQNILEQPLEGALQQQVLMTIVEFDKMGLIEPVKSQDGEMRNEP